MGTRVLRYRSVALAGALAAAVGFGVGAAHAGPGGAHIRHQSMIVKPPPGSTGSSGSGTGHVVAGPPPSGGSGDSGD
jgi:hypothetical protein